MSAAYMLVLLRHGESTWNRENRFTGWTDVTLTERGCEEARRAGRLMKQAGLVFDSAHVSLLRRALWTLFIALDELNQLWLPVEKSWRLNERHYGALQGLSKKETAERFGEAQVTQWRRSFDQRPPQLDEGDPRFPGADPRYAGMPSSLLPKGESLADTEARVMPVWQEHIEPQIRAGRRLLIAGHGNSLRALVHHLEGIDQNAIASVEIPTGLPLIYKLNEKIRPIERYYLGAAANSVSGSMCSEG